MVGPTAFGHFISWTVELFLFGISNYIIVEHKEVLGQTHWVIFMLLPSLNYIFPTVQGTIRKLRPQIFWDFGNLPLGLHFTHHFNLVLKIRQFF